MKRIWSPENRLISTISQNEAERADGWLTSLVVVYLTLERCSRCEF